MTNLDLWHKVEQTDPRQVKPITGKPYKGTSPKPYYLVKKATETFGPCGIGWGWTIASERIEDGADGTKVHIAHVRLWYVWNGKQGAVEHVGQTMFVAKTKNGLQTDEDAPKKSVTDAIVKALSMIGFAGDIFMGRYDDSKYVEAVEQEITTKEWIAEGRDIAALASGQHTIQALTDLFKTERVQVFKANAPKDLVASTVAIFSERRAFLERKAEDIATATAIPFKEAAE